MIICCRRSTSLRYPCLSPHLWLSLPGHSLWRRIRNSICRISGSLWEAPLDGSQRSSNVLMCPISIRPYALSLHLLRYLLCGCCLEALETISSIRLWEEPSSLWPSWGQWRMSSHFSNTDNRYREREFNWLVTNPKWSRIWWVKSAVSESRLPAGMHCAIAETSAIIILLVGVILSIRRVIDWRVLLCIWKHLCLAAGIAPAARCGSYDAFRAIWHPLVRMANWWYCLGRVYADRSGDLSNEYRALHLALGAAIITVLIRVKANLPEGCLYSILMMNMWHRWLKKGWKENSWLCAKSDDHLQYCCSCRYGKAYCLKQALLEAKGAGSCF